MKSVIAMSLKSVGTDVLLMDETHSFIEIIAEILDRAVPSFLIIDRDGRILKTGRNYQKSLPSIQPGAILKDHLNCEIEIDFAELMSGGIQYRKLIHFVTPDKNLVWKGELIRVNQDFAIYYGVPLINAKTPFTNYHLTVADLPKFDYLPEFLFLQQASHRGLEEARLLNESLKKKNHELELGKNLLLNANTVLERRVEERTEKIKNLALIPEQYPHSVVEIDLRDGKLLYLNPAGKAFFGQHLTSEINGLDFFGLAMSDGATDNFKDDFEFQNQIFRREIYFLKANQSVRIFLQDITQQRVAAKSEADALLRFRREQSLLLDIRSLPGEMPYLGKINYIMEKTSEFLSLTCASVWVIHPDNQSLELLSMRKDGNFQPTKNLSILRKDYPQLFSVDDRQPMKMSRERFIEIDSIRQFMKEMSENVQLSWHPLKGSKGLMGWLGFSREGKTIPENENEVAFMQSVADAITLAHEAEELRISNESLFLANQQLNEAYQKMMALQEELIRQEKLSTLGVLIAGIAHEINTPLGAIKASNQTIQETFVSDILSGMNEISPEIMKMSIELFRKFRPLMNIYSTREEREYIKRITSNIESRIPDLVNPQFFARKILEIGFEELPLELEAYLKHPSAREVFLYASGLVRLSRSVKTVDIAVEKAAKVVKALNQFSHGNLQEDHKPFSLRENIDGVITILWNKIKSGATVLNNVAHDVFIIANPEDLAQVWTNIINNALQASSNKCIVRIDYEFSHQNHIVEIWNNGPPIPEDVLPKIFDAFFTTKSFGEGTGLGLNISKKIIEKYNGTMECESNLSGTLFRITLPA
jgi:signal transduction histidine kinase